MKMKKILIANRGEIAVRIIKTARKLGIKTVAIYSEADVNSMAVQMADEAFYIGPSPSNLSYLNVAKILEVVQESGSDAVHPGYGFLSENASFAKELEKIGVNFIGPGVEAVQSMGDKIISKKIAKEAGVSTVPGYMGIIEDPNEAKKIAESVGFPVMVKAAAGGGGRGMRIVHKIEDVAKAFDSAKLEAKNNFGDDRIFIEKFIEKPRHIEIQIIADKHGNVVCLGERECSIQRYNQKVIEEAPSSFLNEKVRQDMYKQSVNLVKKVDYFSAGTIEYIMDKQHNFYFLEMNTRLQVEHPVTELITGVDLVEQMINVANGDKLSFSQEDIKLRGWAMESRIYAEDPARGFLPSSGRISTYQEPESSENVRIDTGVYEGGEVSMFYDAMIAKLCTYGKDRNEAISYMQKALGQYVIEGISNNISFLESMFFSSRFASGDLSTNYISEEYPDGYKMIEIASSDYKEAIYASTIIRWMESLRVSKITGSIAGNEKEVNTRWAVCVGEDTYIVELEILGNNNFKIRAQGKEILISDVNWHSGMPLFKAKIDSANISLKFTKSSKSNLYRFNYLGGFVNISVVSPRVAELMKYMPAKVEESNDKSLIAPISGKVIDVLVGKGEKVKAGMELVVIEAMKMENSLVAERDAVVKDVKVNKGDNVQAEQILIEFN
ncbi:MAG: acetyl/propionyl/methylcrotonyl-CoA carboxylase subunit alpha [Alphaproteobacteria bacterium]|jgi:propionyl-CoA carboxylase alpha chain|nr:acetyl/propionyl/methylcrotonyl-CoA carboxylase subunit alpha [Alphaproteobacteria bacterium]